MTWVRPGAGAAAPCATGLNPPFFCSMGFDRNRSIRTRRPQGGDRVRSQLLLLALLGPAAGCYVYAPVPPTAPEPGAQIRAVVDDEASAQLTSVLGPGVTRLTGMVLDRRESTLSILVDSYFSTRAGDLLSANEPVRIGLANFRTLEEKRFSRGRSVLLGAAFVGGAVLVMKVTGLDRRIFEGGEEEPPGPIDLVVPAGWLRWRVQWD